MSQPTTPDWNALREDARRFPESAFQFVRDGLAHTVKAIHGARPMTQEASPDLNAELGASADPQRADGNRHVTGRDLCMGIRDMAVERYGQLAITVLRRWGFRRTSDFGTLVYAMIDRREMRNSEEDSIEDFNDVYDFDEAFSPENLRRAH